LRGPLPPGETRLQIAYTLPVTDPTGAVTLDLRFGRKLPLLSIYTADTGLRTESERLHRRRPVTTTDRTYIALEAFEVEPSETVQLTLTPLASPGTLPRVALYLIVALAAGVIVSFVAAPLRTPRRVLSQGDDVETQDAARHEREAIYVSLRDLDHDHETAKLSDEDYQSMRRELRDRVAALLRASTDLAAARSEPQASEVGKTASEAAAFCTHCGTPARASDRFCAQCGTRIESRRASA